VPTVGNGDGYFVEPPPGGRGCGYNLLACFPEVTATVTGWLSTLQAAYAPDAPVPLQPVNDVAAPLSRAVVAKLARGWEAAAAAGVDANNLADAAHEMERATLGAAAAAAAADGAAAVGTAAEGVSAAAQALHAAAQAQAQHASGGVRDAALTLSKRAAAGACERGGGGGPCDDAPAAALFAALAAAVP
jgi:hypothetical protein